MDAPWLDLLNSDWHDYRGSGRREDRLQSPQWLRGFLARWQLDRREASRRDTRLALRRLRSLLQRVVATLAAGRIVYLPKAKPRADQPGTLEQQLSIIDVYLDDPTRAYDPEGAWEMARRLVLPHARRRRK